MTTEPASPYRPEFKQALRVFAEVSEAMERDGIAAPILVGGAAVELYSASAIATGDFDVVTPCQDIFEQALLKRGFVRPSGAGMTTRGLIHPSLKLGFEVVGSDLLDGLADRNKVQLVAVDGERFAVISIEDLIADRMGQFASGTAADMLDQARALFRLYRDADEAYIERRIREETNGDYGLGDVR